MAQTYIFGRRGPHSDEHADTDTHACTRAHAHTHVHAPLGRPRNCLSGFWLPHCRWFTILHSASALSVRLAQPRFRQISNRQRSSRPALCAWCAHACERASKLSLQ